MKKRNEAFSIEEVMIPKIHEQDIIETITMVKSIIKQKDIQKVEINHMQIVKALLFQYGKVSFIIQVSLSLLMLIILWILLQEEEKSASIALFLTGSILLSITCCAENIRSKQYGMWELEQSSPCAPAILLIWKVAFLSLIAMFGIVVSSYMVANASEYDALTLLCGGCIPFCLLTGFCMQVQSKQDATSLLIVVYAIVLGVSTIFPMYALQEWIVMLQSYGVVGVSLSILYMFTMFWKQGKSIGSSL